VPGRGIAERLGAVGAELGERVDALAERSHPFGVAWAVVRRSGAGTGSLVAGHLAYRMFLLLLPMGAVVVALAGIDGAAVGDASAHLGLGRSITSAIAAAGEDTERSGLPLLLTGVVAFLLASWGLLGALQYTAALAWRIPTRRFPGKGRNLLRLVGSVAVFVGVLYLSIVVRSAGLLAGLAAAAANTLASFVAFFALSWILPRRCREWFWLLPGAAVGAAGVLALQLVGSYWLPGKVSAASGTYGALGVALAVLTYLFLVGLLVWVVVLVDAVVWDRFGGEAPGPLRRLAQLIPIPTTTIGSGYVPDGGTAATVGGPETDDGSARLEG
jgi:uncharacterized BrkB/YihY/UPF0761 family membrane protein